MEENLGVLREKSVKRPVFLTGLLAVILIIVYPLSLKTYEPAPNIFIMGGIIVYPITFLITSYISKYYGFKESRKSIFIACGLYLAFIILMMISIIPTSNNATSGYNMVLQYLFTNNVYNIGDTRIFYPTLGQYFSVVISFLVSHLLYAAIYNAINKFTVDYLAVGLSLFIAYIIDRLIYMPILYAEGLINGSNTFDYFIKCLTSEFIAAILCSLIIIVVYVIITSIRKKVKKKMI